MAIEAYNDCMVFAYRVVRDGDHCTVTEYCDGEEIAEYSNIPRDMTGALIDELKERIKDAHSRELDKVLQQAKG